MYKLKLSVLLNLMFILTSVISEEGCKGKCEGNVLKFESTKKFDTIGTKHNTTPRANIEKENLKAKNNKKELEFTAKLDNKLDFKEAKFSKHRNVSHKTHNSPKSANNNVNNLEKELLIATEKLKALFKPIKIHTKKPSRNYIKLQRKKRYMNENEQLLDMADNLRYGTSFNKRFDNKFGHKLDLSSTGRLITQGFVNNSRSGNENDYLTRQGHKLSSSPKEPSKLEQWNERKGRNSGYDSSRSQGYANQYFLNPAAAQSHANNIPLPYLVPYGTSLNNIGTYPLVNQPNNLAQPYDRMVVVHDPRLINPYVQGQAPQFSYNTLPNNVPVNLPLQSALVPTSYYPHMPNFY